MNKVDALVYAEVTWNIVHPTEEHSVYKVDALVYAEVTWNIVHLTEEHSVYKVDALVYDEGYLEHSPPNRGTFSV